MVCGPACGCADGVLALSPALARARQVHLLRRLQKEMTGRVRSLRFFETVRKMQQQGEAARAEREAGGADNLELLNALAADESDT